MEANFVTHNTARWNLLSNSVGKVHISSILWFPPGASGEMVSIRPIVSGKKKICLLTWKLEFLILESSYLQRFKENGSDETQKISA